MDFEDTRRSFQGECRVSCAVSAAALSRMEHATSEGVGKCLCLRWLDKRKQIRAGIAVCMHVQTGLLLLTRAVYTDAFRAVRLGRRKKKNSDVAYTVEEGCGPDGGRGGGWIQHAADARRR